MRGLEKICVSRKICVDHYIVMKTIKKLCLFKNRKSREEEDVKQGGGPTAKGGGNESDHPPFQIRINEHMEKLHV